MPIQISGSRFLASGLGSVQCQDSILWSWQGGVDRICNSIRPSTGKPVRQQAHETVLILVPGLEVPR